LRSVQVVVEGSVDGAAFGRVVEHFGIHVAMTHIKGGRDKIAAKVSGYHTASRISPWLVLADLDSDCASDILNRWGVPAHDALFLCRFATREIESWLLADRDGIAADLAISKALIPPHPDSLVDAKATLLNLARRSRSRQVKTDMLPAANSLIGVGPGYNLRLSEFARERWDVIEAARCSASLARSLCALEALASRI
jgi:hypothetical protein